MKEDIQTNGTPFTDEDWKKWYGHKSNKEIAIEIFETAFPGLKESKEKL